MCIAISRFFMQIWCIFDPVHCMTESENLHIFHVFRRYRIRNLFAAFCCFVFPKVRSFAVILLQKSSKSVHGARRTVHLKFENWAMHGYCAFLPSLVKKGEKRNSPAWPNFQTSNGPFSELREWILMIFAAK